ncbi:MAG: hypothetical protein K2K47_09100, partial [Duncaniella sp.]|nr:hypothetical protein [Duncaniella sp.]
MSKLRFLLPAIALGMLSTDAFAYSATEEQRDSLIANHKYIFFGEGDNPHADSIRNLVENFYYDQFRHFQAPDAPY